MYRITRKSILKNTSKINEKEPIKVNQIKNEKEKEDIKEEKKNEISEVEKDNGENKKNKIIHENNLKVIELLKRELEVIDNENNLLTGEASKLKEDKISLTNTYNEVLNNIEDAKDELENLKDINDAKNREYLKLMHERHRQVMQSHNHDNTFHDNMLQNNMFHDNNNNMENGNINRMPNPLTLGEIMDGILLPVLRRQNGNDNSERLPYIIVHHEPPPQNTEEDRILTEKVLSLPSFSFPRFNNDNEKCQICGFELCYNDIVIKVKCKHTFHKNCLTNRLLTTKSSKCPNCNAIIV